MSKQGYKDLVKNFAAIKNISEREALRILTSVVEDYYRKQGR